MEDFDRDVRRSIRGGTTHAGVNVSEDSALKYVTVYACARILAETIGSLPLFVYREKPSGGSDKARDHPLYWLLHDEPNEEMDSLTLRETISGHMALSGNGYGILQHNRRGQVIDIYPWDWHAIRPDRDKETRELFYWITDRGKEERLPVEKVLHVHLWGPDGIVGYSPIRIAREAVGLGLAATEFAARFYGQGMNMGGVLEHPLSLSDKAYERLRKSLEEEGAGLANSWRPLILEEGMKYNRIPMPLKDAQFIEQQKFNRDEICALFRVPPHMVANLERSTHNNTEHQSLEFIMYTMLPWIKRWEQAINRRLFTRFEREQGHYCKFNLSGLLRGDAKSRAEALHIMRQDGIINADEWREMEEMNPQEGGTGKVYLINGNMMPVEEAAKNKARQNSTGGE
ncbi:MAG: phage portal protein [Firmicutes bacterium]|nr:phage portal protein [Bacillota bacterium]